MRLPARRFAKAFSVQADAGWTQENARKQNPERNPTAPKRASAGARGKAEAWSGQSDLMMLTKALGVQILVCAGNPLRWRRRADRHLS